MKELKLVDLGLPSGNLWRDTNEDGYYNWNDAVEKFGESMPKLTDFAELYDYCKWNKDKNGMTVTGPNGNSLFLPASGYRDYSDGGLSDVGTDGYYWSASSSGNGAYCLNFDNADVYPAGYDNLDYKLSIRLIKRK